MMLYPFAEVTLYTLKEVLQRKNKERGQFLASFLVSNESAFLAVVPVVYVNPEPKQKTMRVSEVQGAR